MKEIKTEQIKKSLLLVKKVSCDSADKCKQLFVTRLIPQSKKYTVLGIKAYNEKLAPNIQKSSKLVADELLKIHQKQNWAKRFAFTMMDNSAGLGMAMVSAKLVENFVEVREFGNLWGLLATRPVVSETTYEVLSFLMEFFVALIAFTITEHYQEEYRQKKNSTME
ncbi:MAG: hypothetical protein OEZ15_00300 [Gammaproteobacteria bacterium]|nr:hypothetical protein [Gammaproteobacteria bacterium]